MSTIIEPATKASLLHDGITYSAQVAGSEGNLITIGFSSEKPEQGLDLSLVGQAITINYYIADSAVIPATNHSGILQGITFTYGTAGNVVEPIVIIEQEQSADTIIIESDYDDEGVTRTRFRIQLFYQATAYTQQEIKDIYDASTGIDGAFTLSLSDASANLDGAGQVYLSGGADEQPIDAITLSSYTHHDITSAYHDSSDDIKALVDIKAPHGNQALTTEIQANLSGGKDETEPVLARGLYAGASESELLDLRTQLRKSLTDITSGKQVISVAIAGKQVTKKLPEYSEIKQELAGVNTALLQINPQKYGKPRRRFLMDHRRRST